MSKITRQGTTMQITADLFAGGLTGIREVDVFTAQYNPHRARVRPQVFVLHHSLHTRPTQIASHGRNRG